MNQGVDFDKQIIPKMKHQVQVALLSVSLNCYFLGKKKSKLEKSEVLFWTFRFRLFVRPRFKRVVTRSQY